MLLFYMPVAIGGFVVYGASTEDNIIGNLNKTWLRTGVLVLITGHLLTAFNIILNPVFQGVEHAISAPNSKSRRLA